MIWNTSKDNIYILVNNRISVVVMSGSSNKQKKSWGSSSNITYLAAATHDKDTDSIVDQDDDVVLAGIPNHSFLSQQKLQGEVLDNNEDNQDNDNNDNDIDIDVNHFGVEYNATVYEGRKECSCWSPSSQTIS